MRSLYVHPCCRLKKICPSSFRENCQWLKFPLNGLRAQSWVSPAVGLLPLASGPAGLGMAFPPFLVKQLHRFFWIRETGTGQQVVQLHERYDDGDDDDMFILAHRDAFFRNLCCSLTLVEVSPHKVPYWLI